MTNPDQPTIGDLTARLEFRYENDPLDFLKTGKGYLVVDDKVANVPLPRGEKGEKGDTGRLAEGDVRYFNHRTDEAEAAAEASEASAVRSKASEEAAKTSETNAKTSETNAKTSETNAAKSESAAKISETNAKSSETAASESAADAHTYRQGALTYREGSKDHREAADAAQAAAKTSETNAKTSEVNAKTSETNAATSASATSKDANRAAGSATKAEQEAGRAEEARTDTEAIERALRSLMEDTESWNEVTAAISRLDTRIADGMQQVKDDILGGVGPAYDTLLELAEAFGDNRDAIASITDELSKKADEGHTHTSADITDANHYIGTTNDAGQVVKTHTDGHVYMRTDPPADDALARKKYVDDKTNNKSEIGHKHVVSDTSGLQEALDGKAPAQHLHSIADVDGLNAALGAASKAATWEDLLNKPSTFPPNSHTHSLDQVDGLADELDSKVDQEQIENFATHSEVETKVGKKADKEALGYVTTALGGLSFVVVTEMPSNPDMDIVYLVVEEEA